MTNWNFFDARAQLGQHVTYTNDAEKPWSAAHLLDDMDHHGVAEAIVLDCLSTESSPKDGNPRIVEIVKDEPRLHAAWAGLPPGTDELPDPAEMVRQMREDKIVALYLFPHQHAFPLSDWCIDDLLEPMQEARIPVFITPDEVGKSRSKSFPAGWDHTDLDAVVEVCSRFPKLPIIISEQRIRRSQRALFRALEACSNLHLELSGLWLHRNIEYITHRFGSERLIFGSNWPHLGHGATLATLSCAEISDEDKRNIAGDNLRRLVKWCEPVHPQVQPTVPADELVQWGRTGEKPADIKLWDNHGHLGNSLHYYVPDEHVDEMVREMDRFGVEKCCVFSISGVFTDDKFGNDYTAKAIKRHPDRFVGFTLLNPFRGPKAMREELERCADLGMRGIKLIPTYQGYPEEGPNIDAACEWAHEHKQLILNHYWGGAEQMERLVSTYPNACFFTGHTTMQYADVMKKYKNLYVCSCPVHTPRIVEQVVDSIGADRFMFGSDLTDLPIAWGFGPILFARISEAEKRLILGENLRKVLGEYSLE